MPVVLNPSRPLGGLKQSTRNHGWLMYQYFQFMLIKKAVLSLLHQKYKKSLIPYGCVENHRCRPLYELCILYIITSQESSLMSFFISLMVCDWMMYLNWSIEGWWDRKDPVSQVHALHDDESRELLHPAEKSCGGEGEQRAEEETYLHYFYC